MRVPRPLCGGKGTLVPVGGSVAEYLPEQVGGAGQRLFADLLFLPRQHEEQPIQRLAGHMIGQIQIDVAEQG